MSPQRRPSRSALAAVLVAAGGSAGPGLAVAAASASPAPAAGARLSPAEESFVAEALSRLPASANRLGTGLHVVRDVAPCPSDGLPADDRLWDDRGWLHLCSSDGWPPALAAHVAAVLLFEWAPLARWADLPRWQRLNRWTASVASLGRAAPENRAPEAFATPVGMRSPRWDLATFAAAAFLDQASGDERVTCRLMSQAAFLRDRLTSADVVLPASAAWLRAGPTCPGFERWAAVDQLASVELILAAPSTAMLGSLFGHVLLRIAYRDDAGDTPPYLSRTLAFLADNERPLNDDPGYALKGILGFYQASLHERPFLEMFREYVVEEGRDLRRWRLALDAHETRALLERLWTALGRTRYTYYFFRRNCATLLLDLVDEARSPGAAVARPGLVAAPPSSTLEGWAGARASSGGPLLSFVPEPILSFQSEARLASGGRRAREDRIARAWPGGLGAPAMQALRDTHAQDPAVRDAAYQRLEPLVVSAPTPVRADVASWLRESVAIESHLSAVANQEAAAAANRDRRRRLRANVEALAAELAAPSAAASVRALAVALRGGDPEQRLGAYRALAALAPTLETGTAARARRLALLTSELEYDVARMNGIPGLRDRLLFVDDDKPLDEQAYVVGFEDLIRFPEVTRVAPPLRTALRVQAAARAAGTLEPQLVDAETRSPPELGGPAQRADVARTYERERSRSGIDQLAVLAAVAAPIGHGAHPTAGAMLAGALYDEELGGHRRFGFASDTGFVVARSRVLLAVADSGARIPFYDTRVVGYRALRATVPEARGSTWLGWELYLDTAGDQARAIANETTVGWGLLAPLMARDALADHALLAFGLAARTRDSSAAGRRRGYAVSVPVALEWRATLGRTDHRSWAAARLWVEPLVATGGALPPSSLETGLVAEAHLALAAGAESGHHDPALVIRVEAKGAPLSAHGSSASEPAALTTLLSAGVELR